MGASANVSLDRIAQNPSLVNPFVRKNLQRTGTTIILGNFTISPLSDTAGKTHVAPALGFVAAQHRFSTYYINCHQLIEQLKKAHFENRLPDKLKVLSNYRMLIIDEIGYIPMDIQGANLFIPVDYQTV